MKLKRTIVGIHAIGLIMLLCPKPIPAQEMNPALELLKSPARMGSIQPNLAPVSGDAIAVTWIEPVVGKIKSVRFSILGGETWSSPRTITTGEDLVRFWGELPAVHLIDGKTLAANWAAGTGGGFDVHLAISKDTGASWTRSVTPHKDGTRTEHGLSSSLPWAGNSLLVAWLDGRGYKIEGARKETSLRAATLTATGQVYGEQVLDARVCDCCPTSATLVEGGAIVAYRDRSQKDVRDISIVRSEFGQWSPPVNISNDGWVIRGCPVNGPSVDARGGEVALAWFTAAGKKPAVKVRFSHDAGRTFAETVRIDSGNPIGRVATVVLSDGSAMIGWFERVASRPHFMVRRVTPEGDLGKILRVTSSADGMPRMAPGGNDDIILAWTEKGTPTNVRVARLEMRRYTLAGN